MFWRLALWSPFSPDWLLHRSLLSAVKGRSTFQIFTGTATCVGCTWGNYIPEKSGSASKSPAVSVVHCVWAASINIVKTGPFTIQTVYPPGRLAFLAFSHLQIRTSPFRQAGTYKHFLKFSVMNHCRQPNKKHYYNNFISMKKEGYSQKKG